MLQKEALLLIVLANWHEIDFENRSNALSRLKYVSVGSISTCLPIQIYILFFILQAFLQYFLYHLHFFKQAFGNQTETTKTIKHTFSKGSPLHLQVYFDSIIFKSFSACRLSSSVGADTRRISNRRLCRLSCCRMLLMYSVITSTNSSKLRTIL